jgi:hypothetical protein
MMLLMLKMTLMKNREKLNKKRSPDSPTLAENSTPKMLLLNVRKQSYLPARIEPDGHKSGRRVGGDDDGDCW